MLSFSLSIFLIPYGIFAAIFFIFSFVHMFHLGKFGASGFVAFVLAFIYLAGASIIVYWSWYFINAINWQEHVAITLPNFNSIPGLE